MTRPPIDLGDSSAVLSALADIPVRVRPRCTDLMVMIAGENRRSATILLVDDVPDDLPQHRRVQALGRMWRELRADHPDAVVAVTVCRGGGPDLCGDDLAWHDAIHGTATHAGITCLGVYLSTLFGAVQVLPLAA
jgi:hypothetical protein